MGGSYENGSVYFLELLLQPCREILPGDCDVQWNGVPTSTTQNLDLVADFMNDYSLEVGYIEHVTQLHDFDKPLKQNLVKNGPLKFDGSMVTSIRYEFSQIVVETQSGTFFKEKNIDMGM